MCRKLSLNVVRLLLSVCPDFHWVRYIDSWRSNSRTQIGKYNNAYSRGRTVKSESTADGTIFFNPSCTWRDMLNPAYFWWSLCCVQYAIFSFNSYRKLNLEAILMQTNSERSWERTTLTWIQGRKSGDRYIIALTPHHRSSHLSSPQLSPSSEQLSFLITTALTLITTATTPHHRSSRPSSP
jgi:hypothetical protein